MAKKIKLSEYLAQAPVVENLKNFTGIDAANAVGMMTPERLAAVAGGLGKEGLSFEGDLATAQIRELSPKFKGGLIFASIGGALHIALTIGNRNGGSSFTNSKFNDVTFFKKDTPNKINFYSENGKWYVQNANDSYRTIYYFLVPVSC